MAITVYRCANIWCSSLTSRFIQFPGTQALYNPDQFGAANPNQKQQTGPFCQTLRA
jgi:hypothetical protein